MHAASGAHGAASCGVRGAKVARGWAWIWPGDVIVY